MSILNVWIFHLTRKGIHLISSNWNVIFFFFFYINYEPKSHVVAFNWARLLGDKISANTSACVFAVENRKTQFAYWSNKRLTAFTLAHTRRNSNLHTSGQQRFVKQKKKDSSDDRFPMQNVEMFTFQTHTLPLGEGTIWIFNSMNKRMFIPRTETKDTISIVFENYRNSRFAIAKSI